MTQQVNVLLEDAPLLLLLLKLSMVFELFPFASIRNILFLLALLALPSDATAPMKKSMKSV